MGAIADRIRQMSGATFAQIIEAIEEMEAPAPPALFEYDGWPELWSNYPHKTAKKAAEKAYRAAIKRGVPHGIILEGMRAYVARKPSDRPWLHLATFINGERWEDQEASTAPSRKEAQEPKGGDAFFAAAEFLRNERERRGEGGRDDRPDDEGFPVLIEHQR